MNEIIWVSMGAIIGANLRYLVNYLFVRYATTSFPFGTMIVNCTGSFIIGFFLVWVWERAALDPRWCSFVVVGFCGAYTTFSSFTYETYRLIEQNNYLLATLNILGNNLLSFLAVVLGIWLARTI